MRIRGILLCFVAISSGLFLLACSLFAHPLDLLSAPLYAFSDSIFSPKTNHLFYAGFLRSTSNPSFIYNSLADPSISSLYWSSLESVKSDFETNLLLFQESNLIISQIPAFEKRNPIFLTPKPSMFNYRKIALMGMVNTASITLGFKQAINSWGKSNGRFHIKDDWTGDHLAQTDELSHCLWGFRMTQFLFSTYRWTGLSSKTSQVVSMSE